MPADSTPIPYRRSSIRKRPRPVVQSRSWLLERRPAHWLLTCAALLLLIGVGLPT